MDCLLIKTAILGIIGIIAILAILRVDSAGCPSGWRVPVGVLIAWGDDPSSSAWTKNQGSIMLLSSNEPTGKAL
jgi:hypothetical protein